MSTQANALEDIIANAARGGWDWFDRIDPKIRETVELKLGERSQDAETIAQAWAGFMATPGGRKALEALFDTTLRRTVFFTTLGVPSDQVLAFGAFREGQNALAHEIARQIAIGQGEVQPQPRET